MSDVEIFNRINEAKLQAQDAGITPLQFAEKKVKYFHAEIERKIREKIPHSEDKRLLAIWKAVAEHFKNNP